jgi:hypothetical protein
MHHLGLGDHIVCNGLVRTLLEEKTIKKIYFPIKKHNLQNVSRMLFDIKDRLIFIPIKDDSEMVKTSKLFDDTLVLKLGIFSNTGNIHKQEFGRAFYEDADIDYENRWNKFFFIRREDSDSDLPLLSYKEEEVFVHDDLSRNLIIDESFLLNKKIYRPKHKLGDQNSLTIFDYYSILKRVKQIDCIDSSFACLIDHLQELELTPKFIHRYVRKEGGPEYRNNWKILL